MIQTVNFYDFRNAFENIRPESFSNDGLKALYDHLIEYEESTNETVELDVIAICCDYSEYKDLADVDSDMTTFAELEERTTVIKIDDKAFIIADY